MGTSSSKTAVKKVNFKKGETRTLVNSEETANRDSQTRADWEETNVTANSEETANGDSDTPVDWEETPVTAREIQVQPASARETSQPGKRINENEIDGGSQLPEEQITFSEVGRIERDRLFRNSVKSLGGGEYRDKDLQIHELKTKLQDLREECDVLATVKKDLNQKVQNYNTRLAHKDSEINELRTRLSRVASDRLCDNNPNVTDLSDPYRPGKIADMYYELYTNDWSDAYEDLTSNGRESEKETIHILLGVLQDIYKKSFDVSQTNLQDLRTHIIVFTGNTNFKMSNTLSSVVKVLKDERKKMFRSFLPALHLETNKIIDARLKKKKDIASRLQHYLDRCTELCWLMCIQDPPLHLHSDCTKGSRLDETSFTSYTVRGTVVDFLVWPALLLHQDGPVLRKGVVQPVATKPDRKNAKTVSYGKVVGQTGTKAWD